METGFPPIFGDDAEILILGSFPSVRSRAEGFYYGNPQNRFWRVLAELYGESLPADIPEKRALLIRRRIALWDVADRCDITGSSDASMRNVKPNDVAPLIERLGIKRVYANGGTAARLYKRFILPESGVPAVTLPSTSPANAAWSLDRLIDVWRVIL